MSFENKNKNEIEIEMENAHPEQIVEVNGEQKVSPRPEFVLEDGRSVTDVSNSPEVILRSNEDGDKKYRVECHAVKKEGSRGVYKDVAPEHKIIFENEREALEYGSDILGKKIPNADKGVVNVIDFTEITE